MLSCKVTAGQNGTRPARMASTASTAHASVRYHQHARVVIPKTHHRAHAAQHHIKGDKRLHYHYNE